MYTPVLLLSLSAVAVYVPVELTAAAAPNVTPFGADSASAPEPELITSPTVSELAAPAAVSVTVPVPLAAIGRLVVIELPVVVTLIAPFAR